MNELQKYYAHDEDLGTERNSDEDHCLYKQRDVTPLIAALKAAHVEELAKIAGDQLARDADMYNLAEENKRLRQALRSIQVGACGDEPDEKDALSYQEIEGIAAAALERKP